MPLDAVAEKSLAKAVTNLVDYLHDKYSGIKIKPIASYEDEDFALEISIPQSLPIDEVEEQAHIECIKIEDEYDLFILPRVVYRTD